MDQSKIQRRKAASMMEKGLTSTTPQVKVKKSSEMRMRNEIAKERPIGLKKGGAVRRYADGGKVSRKEFDETSRAFDQIATEKALVPKKTPRSQAEFDDIMTAKRQYERTNLGMKKTGWDESVEKRSDENLRATKKAKGGPVKKSDAKQDKALMSRHNRLMHPGQTSKLAKGGKPMAAGGVAKIRHGAATPSGMPKAQPRHKKNPALI